MPSAQHAFRFDNRFARELPDAGVPVRPVPVAEPRLVYLNRALAEDLGLDLQALQADDAAAVFAGNVLPEGAEPVAQAYAGHQFGGFSPQLGDGRALLLGEVVDRSGARHDIAFKGSGRTPFSRGGDGRAALGPMLREVLISEALHAMGIPSTRALAVVATGERVRRDRPLPGAVLTRVAASHLRVGTLQYFAARGDLPTLRAVATHALSRHDPELLSLPEAERWPALLAGVAERQARLVAQWMNVGFIHGVMNTDNMTLSGQSIDFGPCAFLEAYDPQTVFSSIDHGGRYAYGNQPLIARWNLARLAEALLPLMADGDDEPAVKVAVARVMAVIDAFPGLYDAAWRSGLAAKLGLADTDAGGPLADDWLALLHTHGMDHTLAWRALADAAAGNDTRLIALASGESAAFAAAGGSASQGPAGAARPAPADLLRWLQRWRQRCAAQDADRGHALGVEPGEEPGAEPGEQPRVDPGFSPVVPQRGSRAAAMRRVNPAVIPRNLAVEAALTAASDDGDLAPFQALLAALQRPFDDHGVPPQWLAPASTDAARGYQTFCGT